MKLAELKQSADQFYLIEVVNPCDCVQHPMVIIDKRENSFLVSIGSEITFNSEIDSPLIQTLLDQVSFYKENDLINYLWSTSSSIYADICIINIDNNFKFNLNISSSEDIGTYQCEIKSKWNLTKYKEAY